MRRTRLPLAYELVTESLERPVTTYAYHQPILDELAKHGLRPAPTSSPDRLRDAVRDLYKYEIRKLRDAYLDGAFPKREFSGRVVELRKRYWLLSIPTELWLDPAP